jgi:hypothetical protein
VTDPGKPKAGDARIHWTSRGVRYAATVEDLAPAFVPASSLALAEERIEGLRTKLAEQIQANEALMMGRKIR